jgi:Protein of unknown function (DUF2587)
MQNEHEVAGPTGATGEPEPLAEVMTAEVVTPDDPSPSVEEGTVAEPAKVMRIGSMIKQLLEEVRQAPLDDRSRARLKEIYEVSVKELSDSLSPDLRQELQSLALPFTDDTPSDAELRIAQAQLVGWLEGLFHGIQATLFAQQMAAQAQLNQMRQMGLPAGVEVHGVDGGPGGAGPMPGMNGGPAAGGGTYL